jgi:hypothetical protein
MSRAAWLRIAVLCPILWLLAHDVITRGHPSYLTVGILTSPLGYWMWTRHRQMAIQALLFLGLWAGVIGLAILLEWVFNSGSMAGSGGMVPLPLFYLGSIFLGWIPAATVTIVVAVRRARARTQESRPDHRGG